LSETVSRLVVSSGAMPSRKLKGGMPGTPSITASVQSSYVRLAAIVQRRGSRPAPPTPNERGNRKRASVTLTRPSGASEERR